MFGGEIFVCSDSAGSLDQLKINGTPTRLSSPTDLVSEAIACSVDFKPNQLLVGTIGDGLRIFDGKASHDIPCRRCSAPGAASTPSARSEPVFYAAGVDTKGIVFLDRDARIVQVLDRMLDHRLSRVQQLLYSPGGVLWALLDNAVACVQFPSPISHFEPVFASAMNYTKPVRHQGPAMDVDRRPIDAGLLRRGWTDRRF